MARIVVLGAGIGGMSAAYELRGTLGQGPEITVIGEGDRFSFTPSNPWVAVGWRKPSDVEMPVAHYLAKKNIAFEGVGDSKGMMESEFRQRHIQWITNAKITAVRDGEMDVSEMDEAGQPRKMHTLPFRYSMVLPAFTGVPAVRQGEGLCNPRGFILIDKHQRNPAYPNIFSLGVCVAIPPVEATPVPTGAPKTGFMIESMVTAVAHNIQAELAGRPVTAEATWNAICLADMGDTGAAFVALPQIPPRNVTWAKVGKWVHVAKIAFEKYFLMKMKSGNTEPIYEKYVLKLLGIMRTR